MKMSTLKMDRLIPVGACCCIVIIQPQYSYKL